MLHPPPSEQWLTGSNTDPFLRIYSCPNHIPSCNPQGISTSACQTQRYNLPPSSTAHSDQFLFCFFPSQHCSFLYWAAYNRTPQIPSTMLSSFPGGFRPSPVQFSSVQSLSCVRLFATPWIAARQASLSITNSQSLLKLMPIESVMPSSHLILCLPLLLLPQPLQGFSNESTLHMTWPKYWSFSFSISPSNEHPGLTSFRMDWLDLLAVQGTLKSLLQYHSSKASIFQHSAFFTVQFTSIRDHWKNHSLC